MTAGYAAFGRLRPLRTVFKTGERRAAALAGSIPVAPPRAKTLARAGLPRGSRAAAGSIPASQRSWPPLAVRRE